MQSDARSILEFIRDAQDTKRYRAHHWTGTFEQYLEQFLKNPKKFQRLGGRIPRRSRPP